MNKKICEKCEVRYFNLYSIINGSMYFAGYNYYGKMICQCQTDDKNTISKYSDHLISNIIDNKSEIITATEILSDNTIEPSSCCPYYVEHKLIEWNENGCKNL